jgi:hypothetical protein
MVFSISTAKKTTEDRARVKTNSWKVNGSVLNTEFKAGT